MAYRRRRPACNDITCRAEVLGLGPTIRKSWSKPHEETAFSWGLNAFRHDISLLAIADYNAITIMNGAVWAVANLGLFVMLLLRRTALKDTPATANV